MFRTFGPAMRRAFTATRAANSEKALRQMREFLRTATLDGTAKTAAGDNAAKRRKGLAETLDALRAATQPHSLHPHGPLQRAEPPIPQDASFLKKSQHTAAGNRDYRLYVPSSPSPRGLIVMLHGCKQNAEDFAIGTTMNTVAEGEGFLVAYPTQPHAANQSCCWNWFRPEDQERDRGEPHIIAEMTSSIIREYGIDEAKVFVAGLSAGGAMAAVMAAEYPGLYEAVGIHSGLAHRSAGDVASAFAAMRGGHRAARQAFPLPPRPPRQIVFHGSSDHTVAPRNAQVLMDGAKFSHGAAEPVSRRFTAGARNVEYIALQGRDGIPKAETWLIEGAGHHWSGGDPAGTYAKADGPNASKEMMRFFLGRQLEE